MMKLYENFYRLRCKNLLLTHMGEEMLAQKNTIPLPTIEDGMVIEI